MVNMVCTIEVLAVPATSVVVSLLCQKERETLRSLLTLGIRRWSGSPYRDLVGTLSGRASDQSKEPYRRHQSRAR